MKTILIVFKNEMRVTFAPMEDSSPEVRFIPGFVEIVTAFGDNVFFPNETISKIQVTNEPRGSNSVGIA